MSGTTSRSTVFIFRAEGGIRDIGVTGVQTCALPISVRPLGEGEQRRPEFPGRLRAGHEGVDPGGQERPEIGRASCRERKYQSLVAVEFYTTSSNQSRTDDRRQAGKHKRGESGGVDRK